MHDINTVYDLFMGYQYRIAVNFRGRKLSQICRKREFHGENFYGLLETKHKWVLHAPKFRGKNFRGWLSNLEIREVSPSKVSHYTVYSYTYTQHNYDLLGAPILAGHTDLRLGLSPTCKCINYDEVLVSLVYIMLLTHTCIKPTCLVSSTRRVFDDASRNL